MVVLEKGDEILRSVGTKLRFFYSKNPFFFTNVYTVLKREVVEPFFCSVAHLVNCIDDP